MNKVPVVARRLAKQSALPALVAVTYAVWRHWPLTASIAPAILESFAAAFFLASWFAGQFLRTAKQVSDEQRFDLIIGKLGGFSQASLDNVRRAASDHIDTAADFAQLRAATKLFVPEHVKGMVYALHIDRGDDPQASYVRPWAVSDEVLAASRELLKDAEAKRAAQ